MIAHITEQSPSLGGGTIDGLNTYTLDWGTMKWTVKAVLPEISYFQHAMLYWHALFLVRIKQAEWGKRFLDEAEFPGQVPSVLNSGVHALSQCWAVDVSSVSHQKYPATP